MSEVTKSVKRTDAHKKLALKMQEQADTLTTNLSTMMHLAEQLNNQQLMQACQRAMNAAKECFSEVLAIRTIVTRDC